MRMSVEMTSEGSFLFSNFLENYKDFSRLKVHSRFTSSAIISFTSTNDE